MSWIKVIEEKDASIDFSEFYKEIKNLEKYK